MHAVSTRRRKYASGKGRGQSSVRPVQPYMYDAFATDGGARMAVAAKGGTFGRRCKSSRAILRWWLMAVRLRFSKERVARKSVSMVGKAPTCQRVASHIVGAGHLRPKHFESGYDASGHRQHWISNCKLAGGGRRVGALATGGQIMLTPLARPQGDTCLSHSKTRKASGGNRRACPKRPRCTLAGGT